MAHRLHQIRFHLSEAPGRVMEMRRKKSRNPEAFVPIRSAADTVHEARGLKEK
jgi:hypothetical protein